MITDTETLRATIKANMGSKTAYIVAKEAKISLPAFSRFLKGTERGLNSDTMFKVLATLGITGLNPVS
mgnify:CR=1 FL=1